MKAPAGITYLSWCNRWYSCILIHLRKLALYLICLDYKNVEAITDLQLPFNLLGCKGYLNDGLYSAVERAITRGGEWALSPSPFLLPTAAGKGHAALGALRLQAVAFPLPGQGTEVLQGSGRGGPVGRMNSQTKDGLGVSNVLFKGLWFEKGYWQKFF